MGYRKVPTIHTLTKFKNDDGLIVRMKELPFGKVRHLLRVLDNDDLSDEAMDEVAAAIASNLVSWNLEEEDGTPVPADAEALDNLDFGLIMDIVGEWLDQMTGVDEELGKDSSSGEKFPGQPVTMEAL